jgi:hypothetical protein
MHNLETLIDEWRKAASRSVSAELMEELESHLRENTEELVRAGMDVPDAFERAVTELGSVAAISSELRKIEEPLWLPAKLAIGMTAVVSIIGVALAGVVFARLGPGISSSLLAAHSVAITLGYSLTLLLGGLGICFVSQRAFQGFAASRLRSIGRFSLRIATLAIMFTIAGVLLGMLWAKVEWGRYWAWDAKEVGGFSVIVWLGIFMAAHRFFNKSDRGALTISMLGNIVVCLAWFGANAVQQYGFLNGSSMLSSVMVIHIAFFAVGFIPAGSVRLGKSR